MWDDLAPSGTEIALEAYYILLMGGNLSIGSEVGLGGGGEVSYSSSSSSSSSSMDHGGVASFSLGHGTFCHLRPGPLLSGPPSYLTSGLAPSYLFYVFIIMLSSRAASAASAAGSPSFPLA